MKLTIITATFNSEKTLERCLQSVASQTALANIEHIIIDGRSTDATLAVAAKYSHITKIVSEKDRGIYHAFNKGVLNATGDIIYFLNSDDFFYDDKVVEDVLKEFMDEEVMFLSAKIKVNNGLDEKSYLLPYDNTHTNKNLKPRHQGYFCRLQVFSEQGLFSECFKIAADTYFMKKALQSYKGAFSERIIANFQAGGISTLAEHEELVLVEDAAVDMLLGNANELNNLASRAALSEENNRTIKSVIETLLISEQLKHLADRKILVFGARELSKIIHHLLKLKKYTVMGYLVSNREGVVADAEVYDYMIAPSCDLVINCIEGPHESSITETIKEKLPSAQVISWRYLS